LRCILGNDQEAPLDELNKSNNERSEGKGADMELVGELNRKVKISMTFVFFIRVEIVSGSRYHGDKLSLCLEELADPQNSEEHIKVHVENLFLKSIVFADTLLLWKFGIYFSCELSHRVDTGHAEQPDYDTNNLDEEEDDWNSDDLFGVIKEVCRSIDNVNGDAKGISETADCKHEK
jgi:hypothetical protein